MNVESNFYQAALITNGLALGYMIVVCIITAVMLLITMNQRTHGEFWDRTLKTLVALRFLIAAMGVTALASYSITAPLVWDPTVYVFPFLFVIFTEVIRDNTISVRRELNGDVE